MVMNGVIIVSNERLKYDRILYEIYPFSAFYISYFYPYYNNNIPHSKYGLMIMTRNRKIIMYISMVGYGLLCFGLGLWI